MEKTPLLAHTGVPASSSTSQITIRPARLADASVLASITLQSFQKAEFWVWLHPEPPNCTPAQRQRLQYEIHRHRVSTLRRQLCNPEISTYIAMYEGRPAGFSMEAVNLGKATDPSKRLDLSHRIRHISLYERYLRLWYRVVDYCISCIPESIQTWLWFPTLGPRYLQRRKLLIAQQNETGEKHLSKEDKDKGMMLLYFLGTLPEYERKGIGSTLLKGTLARAREDGTAVYLGATKAGKPLYDRNGFEIIVQEQKGDPEDVSWIETIMRWSSTGL